MALEDIPEMQLMTRQNEQLQLNSDTSYYAKFVEVNHKFSSRNYLFGHKGFSYHLDVMGYFMEQLKIKHGLKKDEISEFKSVGGGMIYLINKEIKICDKSVRYGKYHLDIIKPIIERYFLQHLSNAKLIFE